MSLIVRVVAPFGKDAELITEVLQKSDLEAEVCEDLESLLKERGADPIGPLLIAEETLHAASIQQLSELIEHQPPWSDLPILILTRSGLDTAQSQTLESERIPLGSIVLLERPIRTATLVSSVRAALRARLRQYEIRDILAALKQERETLHVMVDNLPVGVLLAKPTGEVLLANRSVESIFRHPVMSDLNKNGRWNAFHADGRPIAKEDFPLSRAMAGRAPIAPEDHLYQRGDGSLAWLRFAAAPIFDDQGAIAGGVVAISDIDQQKRAESALIQSEKLAAVGRLAASISHEINNPLEAITNLLYLLEKIVREPEAKEYITTAQQELSRVSQIVTHTLRFHRQSTSARAITAEELVHSTLGLHRGRLKNSNIELQIQHRPGNPIICYEGDIRQVLNNLIGNAIDSMKKGGRLVLRSGGTMLWGANLPAICITIADTGLGMPSHVMQRIFEPFYTTKGINGTGLGLWISLGIVSKHHGRLQVRSKAQGLVTGTVFRLILPLRRIESDLHSEEPRIPEDDSMD